MKKDIHLFWRMSIVGLEIFAFVNVLFGLLSFFANPNSPTYLEGSIPPSAHVPILIGCSILLLVTEVLRRIFVDFDKF